MPCCAELCTPQPVGSSPRPLGQELSEGEPEAAATTQLFQVKAQRLSLFRDQIGTSPSSQDVSVTSPKTSVCWTRQARPRSPRVWERTDLGTQRGCWPIPCTRLEQGLGVPGRRPTPQVPYTVPGSSSLVPGARPANPEKHFRTLSTKCCVVWGEQGDRGDGLVGEITERELLKVWSSPIFPKPGGPRTPAAAWEMWHMSKV